MTTHLFHKLDCDKCELLRTLPYLQKYALHVYCKSLHAKRVTLMVKDMQLARRIRGDPK